MMLRFCSSLIPAVNRKVKRGACRGVRWGHWDSGLPAHWDACLSYSWCISKRILADGPTLFWSWCLLVIGGSCGCVWACSFRHSSRECGRDGSDDPAAHQLTFPSQRLRSIHRKAGSRLWWWSHVHSIVIWPRRAILRQIYWAARSPTHQWSGGSGLSAAFEGVATYARLGPQSSHAPMLQPLWSALSVRVGTRPIQAPRRCAFCPCCQTKSNTSQSTTIIQTYEAQIWNHSVRAALRFCL